VFEYGNGSVGWGKVCSCARPFNFVAAPLGGGTRECWGWKCDKIC